MITEPSKAILVASAILVSSTTAFAGCVDTRINHPNGAPTFLPKARSQGATVGVYVNERGIGDDTSANVKRTQERVTRINLGRGQYLEVQPNR